MRHCKVVLVVMAMLLSTSVNGLDLVPIKQGSMPVDSTRVIKLKEKPKIPIFKQEADSINEIYTQLKAKTMFASSLWSNRPPLVELDMRQKSQMRFQISQEKELLFIHRWSFEFRKYVHGPKFAMLTISISI